MKHLLSLLLLTSAGCASSSDDQTAQPSAASSPTERTARVQRFVEALDARAPLSEAQQETVHRIMTEHLDQLEPHLKAITAAPSRRDRVRVARERKPQIDAIRAATESQMKAALDAPQFAAYLELREELRQEFRNRARS